MAFHFRNSLNDLVAKLQSANPHFVRCLKPNPAKTAMEFDTPYVLAQLRYTGISDVVKIRKFGYAMRLSFYEFLQRYIQILHVFALSVNFFAKNTKDFIFV